MKEISNYVADSIPDLNENRTYAGIAASIGTLVQPAGLALALSAGIATTASRGKRRALQGRAKLISCNESKSDKLCFINFMMKPPRSWRCITAQAANSVKLSRPRLLHCQGQILET